jgi:hypothetical protein
MFLNWFKRKFLNKKPEREDYPDGTDKVWISKTPDGTWFIYYTAGLEKERPHWQHSYYNSWPDRYNRHYNSELEALEMAKSFKNYVNKRNAELEYIMDLDDWYKKNTKKVI